MKSINQTQSSIEEETLRQISMLTGFIRTMDLKLKILLNNPKLIKANLERNLEKIL